MTHWRIGGKLTNASVEMLPNGNDIEHIIIESIEFKKQHEINGKLEQDKWIAVFAPNPYTKLPMILNSTNRKRIAKLFNNDEIDDLKNIAVRLTKEKARDPQDGGTTWGLRISKIPATIPTPKAKPVLTTEHEKYKDCLIKVQNGEYTVEQLRKWYDISQEVETLLNKK